MTSHQVRRQVATQQTRLRLLLGGWIAGARHRIRERWRQSDRLAQLRTGVLTVAHAITLRDHRQRWRRPWLQRCLAAAGWLIAALLLALEIAAVLLVVWNLFADEPLATMKGVQTRCDETGFACTVASSIFFTVVPLVVGSFAFVFWRLRRVQKPIIKQAKHRPTELVGTAGKIVGSVVGRDDVCNVLLDSLRARKRRRPYVIVGGVGVGKTAVLVRLTQLLAERGAVPVPIRLRDATNDLDFLEMARAAFLRETQSSTWLAAEAERAWGRLLKIDKIVVLADGLEEAFADSGNDHIDQDRDHRVRIAVRQARKRGYPLVIASREHDALSALDAALLRLEPINEEAALEYVEEQRPTSDRNRLAWIIDRASVVEAPLYLQIVRELHESGQLRHTMIDMRGTQQEILETRDADRLLLRMNLAQSWINALIVGNLENEAARAPLNAADREAAVWHLAALACCGLAHDTLQVKFEMFEDLASADEGEGVYPPLTTALRNRLHETADKRLLGSVEDVRTERKRLLRLNMQVAASNGVRLGLVEPRKEGVRFPHSIMQAHLASMLIGDALQDETFTKALKKPGRELLIALTMRSRRAGVLSASEVSRQPTLAEKLCKAADDAPTDVAKLQLLAAAVDIDSVDDKSDHKDAVEKLVDEWSEINSWDEASRDAKLLAVAAVGDAARRVTEAKRDKGTIVRRRGRELLQAVGERDRALADEIGKMLPSGYPASTISVADERRIENALARLEGDPAVADDAVRAAVAALRSAARDAVSCMYWQFYRICIKEDNYQIRLAGAQEIGDGGQEAFNEIKAELSRKSVADFMRSVDEVQADPDERYAPTVTAWLLPMLVGSADKGDEAAQLLREWLLHVGNDMPLFLEAALAQGFKYAANRRPEHPYEAAKTRGHLASRAEQMLQRARHWYSRLTLLHALGLWALSGTLPARRGEADRGDPEAVVKRWTAREGGSQEHPFVQETAKLVVNALESKTPERYLWIDESSVVTTVGSRAGRHRAPHMRRLWIPRSSGWLVLERHAQQLVADVLILLTLAERGDTADEWSGNLERINRPELPLCLSEERSKNLRPAERAGVTQRSPGEQCKSGCHVGLCPYPPKGQQPYRVELGEAFCRKQRELLLSRRAPWQHTTRSELRRFWRQMEERARN